MKNSISITPSSLLAGLRVSEADKNCSTGRLLVAGDLYAGGRSEEQLANGDGHALWADLAEEISQHDLSLVNLECPLTENNQPMLKSGPALHGRPECANGISSGGFHAVTLSNNHLRDMQEAGVKDTLKACKQAGLLTVGAGKNLEEATRPLYVMVQGLRIAILAIAEGEFSVASYNSSGVWPLNLADNFRQIREAKEQSDFVLVIFHGGVELYPLPIPAMANTCRFFVEAGADGVVCHHIHVPSGLEIYNTAPIVYSTGNFLFDYWATRDKHQRFNGYLVSLDVQQRAVTKIKLIPYFQSIKECRVKSMDSSEAENFMTEIASLSATISDDNALRKEYEKLVFSKRHHYLSAILSLNRVESRLFRMGIWPFWRTTPSRLARLKNQFSCESHHDLVVSVLNMELENLEKQ